MKIYKKIADLLDRKTIFFLIVTVLLISLAPIGAISPYGRATGDDLSNSVYTHAAWLNDHSLMKVLKNAFENVRKMYQYWEGCYTSDFLYAIQPEIFGKGCYTIVPVFKIAIWCGSYLFLFLTVLCGILKFDRIRALSVSLVFWLFTMEFIPSTQNSLFWWAGTSHYTFAFSVCMLSFALLIRYLRSSGRKRIGLLILLINTGALIGGVNYQIALLNFMGSILLTAYYYLMSKDKKALYTLIPVTVEMTGFLISASAPGNIGRGGEEMTFTLPRIFGTIAKSFAAGFIDAFDFMKANPLMDIGMIIVFLLLLEAFSDKYKAGNGYDIKIRFPLSIIVLGLCVYCAMEAPLIFAGVDDATKGVVNMEFLIFFLVLFSAEVVLADMLARSKCSESFRYFVFLPGLLICLVLTLIFRWYIKTSTSYRCYDYMASGLAADFKAQMDEQTFILERAYEKKRTASSEKKIVAYVGPVNDVQGPLQHMPVTEDRKAFTNISTSMYYWIDAVEMTYDEQVIKDCLESLKEEENYK